jgi:hypothetical protein
VQQVPLVEDQSPVEQFAAAGPYPAFHRRRGPRRTPRPEAAVIYVERCVRMTCCAVFDWPTSGRESPHHLG